MFHPYPASTRRPTLLTLLAVAAAAMAMLALRPAPASAACFVSSSAIATIPDAVADAEVNAPEVLAVGVSLDGACRLTVTPFLASPLTQDQWLLAFLGYDPSTGDPATETVDRAVLIVPGAPPLLLDANATAPPLAELTPRGANGFTATIDQLQLPAPASVGIAVMSIWADPNLVLPDAVDWAPDLNQLMYRFPVSFISQPPPPPPPPPAPAVAQQKPKGCVVPKLKGLTVKKAKAALKKAGCKYKIKGKGRVRSLSPKAGTRTEATVQVKAKKKKRKKKHSRQSAAARTAAAA
jgi:hypothetical protein